MKKILISFLTLIMCLFAVLGFNTKAEANGETTETTETFKISLVDGAQIRLEEPYGIKFIGQVTEGTPAEGATYGIVLGKGIHTNLTLDTDLAVSAEVTSTTVDGEFYVTMVNIPKSMHTLYITARGYVKEGSKITYSENHVVRSLYGVAKAYKESQGEGYDENADENAIIEEILNVTDKNVTYNINGGNFEYKTREAMVDAFIADYNTYSGRQLVDATHFFGETGGTDLYAFLHDAIYSVKWGWLFTYINKIRGENHINAITQSDMSVETRGELHNFFNQTGNGNDNGHAMYGCDYSSLEVSEGFWYDHFEQTFTEAEKQFTLAYKPYHQFEGWYSNPECTGEQLYVLTGDITVYAKWSLKNNAINYNLNNDTASMPANSKTSFTAIDEVWLGEPSYDKTTQTFEGWYLDAEFTKPIEKIDLYTDGDVTLYAKWRQEPSYKVTFNANGGTIDYSSREDLIAELITEFNTYLLEKNFQKENKYALDGSDMVGADDKATYNLEISTWALFFRDPEYQVKWHWLVEYLVTKGATDGSEELKAHLDRYENIYVMGTWGNSYSENEINEAYYAISNQVRAFIRGEKFHYINTVGKMDYCTSDFSIEENKNGFWAKVDSYTSLRDVYPTDVLSTPYKPGATFIGWYDENSQKVESVTKDCTLTAVYEGQNYTVTYNLNKWNTHEEMVADFLEHIKSIYYAPYYSDKETLYLTDGNGQYVEYSNGVYVTFDPAGNHSGSGLRAWYDPTTAQQIAALFPVEISKAFESSEWAWLKSYIMDRGGKDNNVSWRYNVGCFLFGETNENASVDFTNENINRGYLNAATILMVDGDTSNPITLMTPTREGYTFGGWYTNAECTGDAVTSVVADVTLYAKWTKNA